MNKIFKLAAVLLAFCASAVSCEKPDGHGESDAPHENAIEFAGVRSEIRTVLVDVPTNTYYFTTVAGISTLEELEGAEYMTLSVGEEVYMPDDGTLSVDLTDMPEGLGFAYFRGDERILELNSETHDAISEGSLTLVQDPDSQSSGVMDFTMTLLSGEIFRGNARIDADDMVVIGAGPVGPVGPEDPLPPTSLLEYMYFTVDGEKIPIGKAFADTDGEYLLVTLTPDASVASYEEIVEVGDIEYLQFKALPSSLDRDIDLLEEPHYIYCHDNESETTVIYPGEGGNLEYGIARLDYDEETGEIELKLIFRLLDGPRIGVHAGAVLTDPAPEMGDVIFFRGETNPVGAAFYDYYEAYERTTLYLTRSEVYDFEEFEEMAGDYLKIRVDDSELGRRVEFSINDDVADISYVNNNTWPPEFLWAGQGASGSYRVDKTGDAEYSVEISVTFHDGSFAYVNYDGPCISVDYVRTEPEAPMNSLMMKSRSR